MRSSNLTVYKNATLLLLGRELEGFADGASLVVASLDNASKKDFVMAGYNGSQTKFVIINLTNTIYSNPAIFYRYSTISAMNYNKDTRYDVLAMGAIDQNSASYTILKKS